jgi:tetratricopeptide (TPR) repeat protein
MLTRLLLTAAMPFLFIACQQNEMRREVMKNAEYIGSLRDYGEKANRSLLEESQRVDNTAAISELRNDINSQIAAINEIIDKKLTLSRSYMLLGLKYKESFMYADAVEAFKKAIEIDPLNSNLYYEAGLCQGQVALTKTTDEETKAARNEALSFLEKAVQLNNENYDAMYALAVTYAYFYDRYQDARNLIARIEKVYTKPTTDMLFVKARIAYGLGNYREAVALFDSIIATDKDADVRTRATAGRDDALARMRS